MAAAQVGVGTRPAVGEAVCREKSAVRGESLRGGLRPSVLPAPLPSRGPGRAGAAAPTRTEVLCEPGWAGGERRNPGAGCASLSLSERDAQARVSLSCTDISVPSFQPVVLLKQNGAV